MITVTVVVDNMPRLGESTTEDYNRYRISLGKLDPNSERTGSRSRAIGS